MILISISYMINLTCDCVYFVSEMQSYSANETDASTFPTISFNTISSNSTGNTTILSNAQLSTLINSGFTWGRIILIIIVSIGMLANGVVQTLYILDKKLRKGTSNLLLRNQTMMDSIACVVLLSTQILLAKGTTATTTAGRWLLCLLINSSTIFTGTIFAANIGLVVIAIERYAKIVHSVSHRNHFRPWMVKLGMVIPWLSALIVYCIPTWSMLDMNTCVQLWPSAISLKAFCVVVFLWQIIMPTIVILLCYTRILMVIVCQKRVSVQQTLHSNIGSQLPEHGKRVVKTMIVISLCFFLCWSPVQLLSVLLAFGYRTLFVETINYLSSVAYLNVILNPVIYSTHLDVVGRTRCFFTALASPS